MDIVIATVIIAILILVGLYAAHARWEQVHKKENALFENKQENPALVNLLY